MKCTMLSCTKTTTTEELISKMIHFPNNLMDSQTLPTLSDTLEIKKRSESKKKVDELISG